MKRKVSVLFVCLCCLMVFKEAAIAADITNPILRKLMEKGILTQEEATAVMQEMEKETAGKEKEVEQKIEKKVTETVPADTKDFSSIAKALKGFKFGLLWYLSYQNGETGDTSDGESYSQFAIKRGYFRVTKEFFPWFAANMTFDVTTVDDPEDEPEDKPNNLDGSIAVRIKYAYGKFSLPDFAFFTKPYFEVGVVHMPWLAGQRIALK